MPTDKLYAFMCNDCSTLYAVTRNLLHIIINSSKIIYCPNGHRMSNNKRSGITYELMQKYANPESEYDVVYCSDCSLKFGLAKDFIGARGVGGTIYCPNGHKLEVLTTSKKRSSKVNQSSQQFKAQGEFIMRVADTFNEFFKFAEEGQYTDGSKIPSDAVNDYLNKFKLIMEDAKSLAASYKKT